MTSFIIILIIVILLILTINSKIYKEFNVEPDIGTLFNILKNCIKNIPNTEDTISNRETQEWLINHRLEKMQKLESIVNYIKINNKFPEEEKYNILEIYEGKEEYKNYHNYLMELLDEEFSVPDGCNYKIWYSTKNKLDDKFLILLKEIYSLK